MENSVKIQTLHFDEKSQKTVSVLRACANIEEAIAISKLLNELLHHGEIYGKPYHQVYYKIDRVINTMIDQDRIDPHYANLIYAMNGTNRGEVFFKKLLGSSEDLSYNDVLNTPTAIFIEVQG